MKNILAAVATAESTFNRVMDPYFQFLGRLGIHYDAPTPEQSLAEILGKLKEPIKW